MHALCIAFAHAVMTRKYNIFSLFSNQCNYNKVRTWGCSSFGRALEWHSRGRGFDSPHLHGYNPRISDNLVRVRGLFEFENK